jgi:lactate permease
MMLAVQAAPLLVLLGLLASGRVGPLLACGLALGVALPGIALTIGGPLPDFLLGETLRAAWLALQPIAVMTGGLLFHAAVGREGDAGAREATAARVFAATLPLGAFLESVTGFAVGRSSRWRRCGGWGCAGRWRWRSPCRRWCWCPGAGWGRARRWGRHWSGCRRSRCWRWRPGRTPPGSWRSARCCGG